MAWETRPPQKRKLFFTEYTPGLPHRPWATRRLRHARSFPHTFVASTTTPDRHLSQPLPSYLWNGIGIFETRPIAAKDVREMFTELGHMTYRSLPSMHFGASELPDFFIVTRRIRTEPPQPRPHEPPGGVKIVHIVVTRPPTTYETPHKLLQRRVNLLRLQTGREGNTLWDFVYVDACAV